ncbi:MAG: tetraacyldisaccharide 4'-kinase, partial [Gammaproteobacteria bacterium]|nr:tetraacyldisaccharide 4'-kinase [Gammaproteobacteria bacterium]
EQGYFPGLVSRGYRGKATSWPQVVTPHSNPKWVGDEPVLIAKKTQCPMVVGPDRVAAVEMLLRQFPCDVVISDDGLQHYALSRDLEIAVVDGERRFGNGFCLPAGPLREPLERLQSVKYIICNGGVARQGEHSMQFVPGAIYQVEDPTLLLMPQDIMQRKIHAVCGIGNPKRFFDSLRSMGFEFSMHVFPDHHHFTHADIDIADDVIIIMTEKDAVKCQPFVDKRHYCLPITVSCPALQDLRIRGETPIFGRS